MSDGQNMVTKYVYDPFGKVADKVDASPQPFTFVGQHSSENKGSGTDMGQNTELRIRYFIESVFGHLANMFTRETVIKFLIFMIVTVSTYSFISLHWSKAAWLWTSAMAIGLLLLFIFSPEHKITKGIRSIQLIYWPFLMFVPVFIVLSLARYEINIEARLIMGLCFLIFEFGMETFWSRVFRRKKSEKS